MITKNKSSNTTQRRKPLRSGRMVQPRPANMAQIINPRCHYYEYRGSLEIYISEEGQSRIYSARVPWSRILKSLRRCRPEVLG